MKMNQFQATLPKLPLPTLEGTCTRYLETVAPLLTPAELAQTTNTVASFLQGAGPALQKQLESYSRATDTSYVYDFVLDMHLEEMRFPLPINISSGAVMKAIPAVRALPLARQAAILLAGIVKFYRLVEQGDLEPDMINATPLCMHLYPRIFGTTRIPGIRRDTLYQPTQADHIVVICRNAFYTMPVRTPQGLLTCEQLEGQLAWILANAPTDAPAVGALTALNRPHWAIVRGLLTQLASANHAALAQLDNALLVLCLDEQIPPDLAGRCRNVLHGDGRNRWFDKGIQVIVTPDGHWGTLCDHAIADGTVLMRFMLDVERARQAASCASDQRYTGDFPQPQPLQWQLSAELQQEIERAELAVDQLIAEHTLQILDFEEYGDEFITKQMVGSAGGLVEIAIQLAYVRLFGKLVNVYQPAHTRRYYHGRTEAIRPVTPESAHFIQQVLHGASEQAQLAAFQKAIFAHRARELKANQGYGVDRHLQALYYLARAQQQIPALFEDKAYKEILSKSLIGTGYMAKVPDVEITAAGPLHSWGYDSGRTVPGCYAVSFFAKPEKITMRLVSRENQVPAFAEMIKRSLTEIGQLLTMLPHRDQ